MKISAVLSKPRKGITDQDDMEKHVADYDVQVAIKGKRPPKQFTFK